MTISKAYSAQPYVLDASIITIEVDLSKGLHAMTIVGLAGKAVDEAKDRVSAAIKNSGWTSPKSKNQKVVVSLAPADLKKDSTGFDLGIALAYLSASEEIRFNPHGKLFIGELSLDGHVEPIKGVLPMILEAKRKGFGECFVPKENATEAAIVEGISIYPVETLSEVVAHINEKVAEDASLPLKISRQAKTKIASKHSEPEIDFTDISGQFTAKRALEIACAGGHNVIMYGPPGTGKTMLAKAAAGILPTLAFDDMISVTSIYSVYDENSTLVTVPPVRAPHHTASYVSIIGGGATPRPGEVTLAHKGILFLDEMPEFSSQVLETLREPLEEGHVRISRAKGSATYPAKFILIGAMNPCPCGNFGVMGKECRCSPLAVAKYRQKLSGPIADRIDLWVEVSKVDHAKLHQRKSRQNAESSAEIRKRIEQARKIQDKRYKKEKISVNGELSAKQINQLIEISDVCKKILDDAGKRLDLSARSYHRLIKTSRTIADLAGEKDIKPEHVMEALSYRAKIY